MKTLTIGDTSQNIFLRMDPENAHLHSLRHEAQEVCFTFADKIPVQSLRYAVGGNAANAAVSLARLGFTTGIYTHLGGDDQGAQILRDFSAEQIASDYVVIDRKTMTNSGVIINLNGERTILVYHEPRHYVLPKLEPADWLYLTSMGEGSQSLFPAVIHYAQEHAVNLCYQPGTFQLKLGAEQSQELLAACKMLALNKEEAERYLGIEPTEVPELLDRLQAYGPEIVLITDGSHGAYATNGQEYLHLDIITDIPRIETTGAGDAFASAFMAALACGKPLAEALRWGQIQSSSVIQQVGPQAGLLSQHELAQLLAKYHDLQPERIVHNT